MGCGASSSATPVAAPAAAAAGGGDGAATQGGKAAPTQSEPTPRTQEAEVKAATKPEDAQVVAPGQERTEEEDVVVDTLVRNTKKQSKSPPNRPVRQSSRSNVNVSVSRSATGGREPPSPVADVDGMSIQTVEPASEAGRALRRRTLKSPVNSSLGRQRPAGPSLRTPSSSKRGLGTSSRNPQAGAESRCALLVEDNRVSQQITALSLHRVGFARSETASNGEEAVAFAKERVYDLILMDIHMPNMDGCEATAAIRTFEGEQGRKRARIVGLTSTCEEEALKRYTEAGLDGCIEKGSLLNAAIPTVLGELTKQEQADGDARFVYVNHQNVVETFDFSAVENAEAAS